MERIAILQSGEGLTSFCKKVGLSYEKLKKCHQRKTSPDVDSLVQIARYFRVDLQWLIQGESASTRFHSKIGRKIKNFRKKLGWSQRELAKKLSTIPDVVDLYEKGKCPLSTDLLQEIAKKLTVPFEEFLLEGDSLPVQVPELKVFQATSTRGAPSIRDEDYVSIPLTASSIAAGHPIIPNDNIEDYVLLHIRAAGRRTNLVASRVDGDSMEPMLHSRDIVIIDRDDTKIVKNKMYAIFHEEGLTAKYVERQKDLLILRPINPNFQVQVINLNEHSDPIVGRIIGAWKDL